MKKPLEPTGKKRGKRSELADWLDRAQPAQIGEPEFEAIRAALAPISESYLTKLLRESGVALTPMIQGVRQSNLEELESSLLSLLDEYGRSEAQRRNAIRRIVITAKDHARWSACRAPNPEQKQEMLLWMTTWLENPAVFPDWVRLRLRANQDRR
ncbi:MAG TPA: hypothetical protein VNX18_09585 [Bryobacteraceae bacterium]|jgi:hypothetical protein|nr:hypothetical protein [Bryobacteraceae bacterium]